MTPDRLALDLHQTLNELGQEKARALQLHFEVERQNREIDRLRGSVHRHANSRLLAEEALDETRERLQMAVDAAGLALWDWQVPSAQMFLTARWGELVGELVGDLGRDAYWAIGDLQARLHPEDEPLLQNAVKALLEGREQRAVVQHRVSTPTGWMWVETHGMVAEHDPKGKPLRLMGTLANISERKRIEQDGAMARELAEQSSRAKSEFLTNMGHEVRTPLNALVGLTRMLMDSPLNSEQANWLSLMDSSAQSLLALFNDVLDLSRIEAGKLEIVHARFDLHRVLREAADPHAQQARAKSLSFQIALHSDLPQWVMGDPGRLGQVVGNLLSNAVKFTPRNGRVDVTASIAEPNDQAPRQLRLAVQDSGVGIARKQQATIFEAFTQADTSSARRFDGSGLGLAICARLAGLMGGSIDLKSELGQGSTFTLALPLQEAPVNNSAPLSASMELTGIAEAGQRFAGMVVLLAEDNPVNELMLRQLLLRLGCTVRVARGGAQAVAQWEQGGIDMVLMDVQMPGMSGLQATQMIREAESRRRLKRTPIVAVTANAMPGDRQTCLAAGMDGYTPKPVSPQALMQEMDRVLALLVSGQLPAAPAPEPPPPAAAATRHASSPEALDVDKLRRRLDGDEETLRQLALAMRGDLVSRLADMQRALEARDTAAAVAHAHGLKGSLGSMTAERGARLAKGLELAARAEDWGLFGRALPLMRAEARQIDRILARILGAGGNDLFGSTEPPVTVY